MGEPGAGKTTLLLELARTLLERAEGDECHRLPVVFNLSSWAQGRQPLAVWLVEELWTKYQVPHKVGKAWIETDQVLPLLDGLDEVAESARSACVQAINAYYQSCLEKGTVPLVVCCRSKEYTALPTQVTLRRAVSIQPFTEEQINSYLELAAGQVEALRFALQEDAELHALAQRPLMLTIFTLAYQGVTPAEIPTEETREVTLRAGFASYVERMLRRRKPLKRWKAKQVISWLTFLAKQMHQHNQTVFSVEDLQPSWLPSTKKPFPLWKVEKIEPAETFTWSWKALRQTQSSKPESNRARQTLVALFYLTVGLASFFLLAIFIFFPNITVSLLSFISYIGSFTALIGGGLFVFFPMLVASELGGRLLKKRLAERAQLSPNEGVWRSARNGLILMFGMTVIGILLADALVWALLSLSPDVSFKGLLVGLLIGHLFGLVGGGYIFIHRLLRDYFVTLKTPSSEEASAVSVSLQRPYVCYWVSRLWGYDS